MPETVWEPPSANALILAERVFRDRDTGEWIIAGVFNRINVRQLPAVHPRMDVFFQITNVARPVDLRLRIEHSDGDVLLDLGGPISSQTPLEVIEKVVVINNLPLKKAGKHWVQLMSQERLLTAAPLYVTLIEEKPSGDAGSKPDDERG